MKQTSVLIVGVGGQGTLLASRVLGRAALMCGNDVKISEVHGMSQRGGSVITYVKYGSKVYSPLIDPGCADYILAFELLEAYRALPYLNASAGRIIASSQRIDPMSVITGSASYPDDIVQKIGPSRITLLNALDLAKKAGSVKSVNSVLLGAFAKHSEIPFEIWTEALSQTVPQKTKDVNLSAFMAGFMESNPIN